MIVLAHVLGWVRLVQLRFRCFLRHAGFFLEVRVRSYFLFGLHAGSGGLRTGNGILAFSGLIRIGRGLRANGKKGQGWRQTDLLKGSIAVSWGFLRRVERDGILVVT